MQKWKDKKLDGWDFQKIIKNIGTYFVLALALAAMTFFGVCDPTGYQTLLPSGAAAKVADLEISSSEFRRAYVRLTDTYQRQFKEQFNAAQLQISRRALEQLVDEYIIYSEALNNGFVASEKEILANVTEYFKDEKGKFSRDNYDRFLRGSGYTEKDFHNELKRQVSLNKLRVYVASNSFISTDSATWTHRMTNSRMDVSFLQISPAKLNITIPDADVTAYLADSANQESIKQEYEKKKDEFNRPKEVRARHILIGFEGARNASAAASKRSKEDAKSLAGKLAAQARGPGADFSKLASENTDDPTGKNNGGDLGFFRFEAMVEPFSKAAFDMKINQISAPVESPFGFHVIKVEEIRPAVNTPLEAAQKELAVTALKRQKAPSIIEAKGKEVLTKLSAGADASSLLNELGTSWRNTGSFAVNSTYIPQLGNSATVKQALAKLTKPEMVHPELVRDGNNWYVLKLNSFTPLTVKPNKGTLEIAQRAQGFSKARSSMADLVSKIQREYKDKGKTWISEEYANLDNTREAQAQGY